MHVSTSLASLDASPSSATYGGARLWLAGFLALRTLDVSAVGYQALVDSTGASARWLVGGGPLNGMVMATNLIMLVGGASLVAIVAVLARWPFARMLALGSGYLTMAWLAMQIVTVGPGASWRLPIAIVSTVASLLVCWMLPDPPARDALRAHEREA